MDKDLYKIMEKLMQEKSSKNTSDVKYIGTISLEEQGVNGPITIAKDVIVMIDVTPDGNIIEKYYDENQNFLAGRGVDGELFPSAEYRNDDLGFLNEIDAMNEDLGVSFNEVDQKLEKASKKLGIKKSQILSMSSTDLDVAINGKEGAEISLSDDKDLSEDEKKEQNKNALDNIASKQEIDLDRKIDNKHTLAEVLGVPAGSKLLVVNSDMIIDNENTTRFSCLIQGADGSLEEADMLNQIGGKNSDKNIYETNRDGSKVENKVVQSTFGIDSPLSPNGILSIRIGTMGTIEVGYGEMDRTSHNDAFTQRLETDETYPVTSRVREEFNQNKGIDNIPQKMDEIKMHEQNGCDNMTLDETDGNYYTGHIHAEDVSELILSDENVRRNHWGCIH